MSAVGQPIDPVAALAAQQPQMQFPPGDSRNSPAALTVTPQEFDPVMALAQGHLAPPPPSAPVIHQEPAWADMIRALPGGIAKGISGIAGLPGDASRLLDAGANFALNKAGIGGLPSGVNSSPTPTSADINSEVSKPFGGYYKPQTVLGQYAETVASFAPNAIMPGTMGQKLARVLIPGATSETAGQLTKDSPYEPLARALGAVAGGIGEGMGEGAIFRAKNPAPTLDDLQTAKTATYKAADNAGVVISPQSFQKFASDLGTDLTSKNVVQADIHKNALDALSVIQDEAAAGAPISLSRADAIRQAVNGAIEKAAGANGSKTDLNLAMKVKSGLDNYLDQIGPTDVVSGDPQVAVPILKSARDLAQRQFKGEQMQKMIDLAGNSASTNYSASGYEQALRAQFKNFNAQLIKNPSMANGFSDAERAAIQKVAEGGPIGNALRWVGKFSAHGPVSAGAGIGLGALLGHSVGGGEGGMLGAMAVPMVGELGRYGATAATSKNAQMAAELMRRGAPLALPSSPVNPGLSALLLSKGVHP